MTAAHSAPTATAATIRAREGSVAVRDGPYAQTAEPLGGYFLVDVDSLDDAVELATALPVPAGGVEVRPAYAEAEERR